MRGTPLPDRTCFPQEVDTIPLYLHRLRHCLHLLMFTSNLTRTQKASQHPKDESNRAAGSRTSPRPTSALRSAMFLTKVSMAMTNAFVRSPGSALTILHWTLHISCLVRRSAIVSLIRFCRSLFSRLLSPNKFGINRTRQNVHSGMYVIIHPRLYPFQWLLIYVLSIVWPKKHFPGVIPGLSDGHTHSE